MARGWESKSVESQIEDARSGASRGETLSAEARRLQERRKGLELSRKRVLQDIAETRSPARLPSLEAALAHLDAELAKLGPVTVTPNPTR